MIDIDNIIWSADHLNRYELIGYRDDFLLISACAIIDIRKTEADGLLHKLRMRVEQ